MRRQDRLGLFVSAHNGSRSILIIEMCCVMVHVSMHLTMHASHTGSRHRVLR